MAIESARILPLTELLTWDRARVPGTTLTVVQLAQGIDTESYASRDFELAYRDLVVAAALSEVALQTSDVWGFSLDRPALPAIPGDEIENRPEDRPATVELPGSVAHVLPSSLPLAAVNTDRDLYARDLLLWEVAAQLGAILADPPIVSIDSGIAVLNPAWSLAEGANRGASVNPAIPLSVDLFKNPDVNLAQRDNDVAAFLARAWEAMNDVYSRANRLLVQINDSSLDRDPDMYVLLEDTPTQRVWITEPGLTGRNRIVFDKVLRQVTWLGDDYDFKGNGPANLNLSFGDVSSFVVQASVPGPRDAEFYRQKAAQLRLGEYAEIPAYYQPNANLDYVNGSGAFVGVDDVMLASDESYADFTPDLSEWIPGVYRFAFLFEANRQARLYGSVSEGGWPIVSATAATITGPGQMNWSIKLVPGTYSMRFRFADLSAATPSFQLKIIWQDSEEHLIYEGALIYGRSDAAYIQSPFYVLTSDGTPGVLTIERTDVNSGQLTVDVVQLAPFGSELLDYQTELIPLTTGADVPSTYAAFRGRSALDSSADAITSCAYRAGNGETITNTFRRSDGLAIPADVTVDLVVDGGVVATQTSNGSQTSIVLVYVAVMEEGTISSVASKSGSGKIVVENRIDASGDMRLTNGSVQAKSYGFLIGNNAVALDAIGGNLGGQIAVMRLRLYPALTFAPPPFFSWNFLGDNVNNPKENVAGPTDFTLIGAAAGAATEGDLLLDFESAETSTVGVPSQFAGVPGRFDCVWFDFPFASVGDVRFQLNDLTLGALYLKAWDAKRIELQRQTPDTAGYEGWKRAWLEAALNSVVQAWRTALDGEAPPDLLVDGLWNNDSSENWMNFIEGTQPRLRQAFRLGRPSDVGQPALTPIGLMLDDAGFPTLDDPTNLEPVIQALQPWMVRYGLYVSSEDFWPTYYVADSAGPQADFTGVGIG